VNGGRRRPEAVDELCVLLNQRIKDSVYHVTPEFLKNPWNSYSYEFAAYLYEFCELLTGDPNFIFAGGMEKCRRLFRYWRDPSRWNRSTACFRISGISSLPVGRMSGVDVTPGSATLAMRFSDRTLRQFGPFRRRCTYLVCSRLRDFCGCSGARARVVSATLTNLSCVSNDDEWCRWLIRWQSDGPARWGGHLSSWRRHRNGVA